MLSLDRDLEEVLGVVLEGLALVLVIPGATLVVLGRCVSRNHGHDFDPFS